MVCWSEMGTSLFDNLLGQFAQLRWADGQEKGTVYSRRWRGEKAW